MLVDSDLERRTLEQILSVRAWLRVRKAIRLSIEKPLFDLAAMPGPGEDPAPPCIPDFMVRAEGIGPLGRSLVIVETMGFEDEAYRERKHRGHAAMQAVCGGAPLVEHDFHMPADRPQEWRDQRFWRDLRWAVTGPEAEAGARPRPGAARR